MPLRRLVLPLAGLATLALSAAPAAQAQVAPDGTVVAYGQASVKPAPRDRMSNASIAAAVRAAKAKALPQALADAKQQATDLATAAGVTLGPLLSISNEPAQQSPFYGPSIENGTFGPGKYCGTITSVRRVTGKDGKARFIRRRHRTCRVPQLVSRQVVLTYAIA